MKKILLTLLLPAFLCIGAHGGEAPQPDLTNVDLQLHADSTQTLTFRFIPGEDMFYIPWNGNDAQLNRLYELVDEYRTEITSGKIPVHVNGYCASGENAEASFKIAVTRSNRVKSELITNKGLAEENFVTQNHTTAYTAPDGKTYRDMVVVTLRIPARNEAQADPTREEQLRREREVAEQARREQMEREHAERERAESERAAREQAERERAAQEQADQAERKRLAALDAANAKPYCLAVRTNLLYDAFLMPNLGLEWRINRHVGVQVNYGGSYWGDEHGKVQKMWLVNPEVRWYMLDNKRFYMGASANFGEYNIYKGMLGGLFSGDTGYQGKLWNAGLTVGYQLSLSRSFSLDFNLGLGYTKFDYDSFNVVNQKRVFKEKDASKNFWGPTQAGVSLVWTLGGKK